MADKLGGVLDCKEKTTLTTEEKLDRLTGIVDALASSVVAHDSRIEALIKISEENALHWKNLERQWQAYLNTLPRR